MLRKNFFSKNFEALYRNSAKRYGDSADEIFAGVEAFNALMEALSGIPRLMQFYKGGRRDETLLPSGWMSWVFIRQSLRLLGLL